MIHPSEATGTRGGFGDLDDVNMFIRSIADPGIQRAAHYEQQDSGAYVAIARVPCTFAGKPSGCVAEKLHAAGFTGVIKCANDCKGNVLSHKE